jgi:hypothetical protein
MQWRHEELGNARNVEHLLRKAIDSKKNQLM